jgi:hypothetical protein
MPLSEMFCSLECRSTQSAFVKDVLEAAFQVHPLFSGPQPSGGSLFDFRAHFCHSAPPMETHAFGLRLRANAPEGQKRFPISYCPRQLFLVPGLTLALLGPLGYLIALPGPRIGGVTFDAHTMLFASLAIIAGYQSALFAIFAKTFAIAEGLLPADFHLEEFRPVVTLERGLIGGYSWAYSDSSCSARQ